MSFRMVTTAKIPTAPALLNETKFDFQRKIKKIQSWHEIPEALIINFDQTPLPYICSRNALMQRKDPPLVGEGKKKQITGFLTFTMSGSFLSMQLIYKGTTNRCLPIGVDFPADFDVTCMTNHWSNESKVIQHLEKIVFRYIEKKKKRTESSFVSKGNADI